MLARIALFALMLVGLLGFGGVAWISLRPVAPASQAGLHVKDMVPVLVAARPLRAGNLLKPEDLAASPMARRDLPEHAFTDSQAARAVLLGAMIKRNIAAGQVILPPDALNPGDRGFLAAVLGPGMRAVTVGVDAVSGLAGLIWPGDHVDLLLTQAQDGSEIPASRRVSGETILHNVRVIAIDRQLVQGATSESPQGQVERTVTLEVTPADAARVAVAARLGRLSLAVVAAAPSIGVTASASSTEPAAATERANPGVVWGGDVSPALRGEPAGAGGTVRVFQGPSDSKEIRF